MSKSKDGQVRGKYTLTFKLEAVRLVKGGQAVSATAKGHSETGAVSIVGMSSRMPQKAMR